MRTLMILLTVVPALNAQAIIEHAVAASVGSVAGVAGKKVSEGLDKALAVVTQAAAGTPEPVKAEASRPQAIGQRVAAPEPGTAVSSAPLAPASPVRRPAQAPRGRDQGAKNRLTGWELSAPAVPEPAPQGVTPDEVRQIEVGMARAEVLAKLGAPVSRFSIPDDTGLIEVYHYHAHGEPSGTVRLLNGNVTTVRPN